MTRKGWFLGAPWQGWAALVILAVLLLAEAPGRERVWWRVTLLMVVVALFAWGVVVRFLTRKKST